MSIVETLVRAIFRPIVISSIFRQELFSARLADDRDTASMPIPIALSSCMNTGMLGPRDHHKILDAIIRFITIEMVYNLVCFQWPTKMLAHYIAMLRNIADIAFFQSVRMVGALGINIPIRGHEAASLPASITHALAVVAGHIARIFAVFHSVKRCPTWFKFLSASTFALHNPIPFKGIISCLTPKIQKEACLA